MFRPIYEPRTRAREYCDLAVNIYDSCPHGCTYCYARAMAKRFGKPWGDTVNPRPGIVEAVRQQLAGMRGQGKKIMLCFTCDPYPIGFDTTATREVIGVIKESGNHVQILTKGDETAQRDFDLLDSNDSFGITYSGDFEGKEEPGAARMFDRFQNITAAYQRHIPTWVSCEPVLDPQAIFRLIRMGQSIDLFRIGKMNHRRASIHWGTFGRTVEALCLENNRKYYIKEDLRQEMGE